MLESPQLREAQSTVIDLMAAAGEDPYKKTSLKLLIDILDFLKAHDSRITEVEGGFVNGDPPSHRKIHERDIASYKAWRLDLRKILMAGSIASLGAIASWLIPLIWNGIRVAMKVTGNAP